MFQRCRDFRQRANPPAEGKNPGGHRMTKILTSAQMGTIDRITTERCGIPSLLLMENAGMHICRALEEHFEDLTGWDVSLLCGIGNNGGDGFVAARQLAQREAVPTVYLLGDPEKLKGDARINFQILAGIGIEVVRVPGADAWRELREEALSAEIVVDAILGTGINRPIDLDSFYGAVVEDMAHYEGFLLAVDVPSGMLTDSLGGGGLMAPADATVTFTAPKISQVLGEDVGAIGDLYVVPIGTPPSLLEENPDHWLELMTPEVVIDSLPERAVHAHKGTCGHVGVVAGSMGKSGAAGLCARSALKSGAGLVTAFVPAPIQSTVAASAAELMTEGMPATEFGAFAFSAAGPLLELIEGKTVMAIGPGLGRDAQTIQLVRELIRQVHCPVVLDADGLNAFEGAVEDLSERPYPLVLTPHPGELSRLVGLPLDEVRANRLEIARNFAMKHRLWVVSKSFRTFVAAPDGSVWACPLGNPGMATAGIGDTLTGVLAATLAARARGEIQPDDVTRSVVLGVFVHSLAGDAAEDSEGSEALNAEDLIEHLGGAFLYLHSRGEE